MVSRFPHRSISSLYPLALAEGEGVGTAYEYYAKRLLLARWLAHRRPPHRLLIAGLPEKYGSSLDAFLLAQELAATEVVVIEDRAWALEKCRQSLRAAQAAGQLTRTRPQFLPVKEMGLAESVTGEFDLCWSSEVLQRFDAVGRQRYIACFANRAHRLALFVPNGDNSAHRRISGLAGLSLNELRALIEPEGASAAFGYVDLPPFPPGLTRSAAQRERAVSGKLEALAMWSLGNYARLEMFLPSRWRSRHAHIVYGLSGPHGTPHQQGDGE